MAKRPRNLTLDLRACGFFVREIADEVDLVSGNGTIVRMSALQWQNAKRQTACDKCGGTNDRPEYGNYCTACQEAYRTRVNAQHETRPVAPRT